MDQSRSIEALRRQADQLLIEVRSDARGAADAAEELLAGDLPHDVRSVALRAAGLAARATETLHDSIDLLRRSVEAADHANDAELAAEARLSLSGSLAIAGDTEASLQVLQPDPAHSVQMAARYDFQRATVLGRLGRAAEALDAFDEALNRFQAFGDTNFEARTQGNLGRLRLDIGELDRAETHLNEAIRLHRQLGFDLEVAGQLHNLGELAACRGDLVTAMERFARSAETFEAVTDTAFEPQVGLGDTLIAAGLFGEAKALALRLDRAMDRAALSLDQAEARLLLARAEVGLGNRFEAAAAAQQASDTFAQQQREAWALRAELLAVQAAEATTLEDQGNLATESVRIAAELDALGQLGPAAEARAEAVLRFSRAGRLDEAKPELAALEQQPGSAWLQRRFLAAYARASFAAANGHRAGAFRAIRQAVELSERHRFGLGATELVAGTAAHTDALLRLAIDLAQESGDQRTLFRWTERARASALRVRPVRPPTDEALAASLAEVRSLEKRFLRADADERAALAGDHRRAVRKLVDRERTIASGLATATAFEASTLADTLTTLGPDQSLLSLFEQQGRLWGQLLSGGRTRQIDLGSSEDLAATFGAVKRRVDVLARLGHAAGTGPVLADIENRCQRLEEVVGPSLDDLPDQQSLVLVPTPALFDAPWRLIPSLVRRALVVAPSVSLWARHHRAQPGTGTGLIAGPDLELAAAEVKRCARHHPDSTVLTADEATVERTLALLQAVDVIHLACHGSFRPGNAQLASLRLADGPLPVLELERLSRVPRCVILSACSTASGDVVGGSEILGLVTTFLRLGADTVLASTGLVEDSDDTLTLMDSFHHRLAAGRSPADALVEAGVETNGPGAVIGSAGFLAYGTATSRVPLTDDAGLADDAVAGPPTTV